MAGRFFNIATPLLLVLLLGRCAQIVPLGGGKRDVLPPKLQEAVPANKTVNFKGAEILLKFDEFIKLNDISNQLIVTPKLKTAPEVTAEGRKLKIIIKPGELASETTYRFYFGSAIADMHESNALRDFEYIFSTGPVIDSLKLSGSVTDAFNNAAVSNVLVGVYERGPATDDSLIYKTMPDYIARTDAGGKFTVSNMPSKSFSLFAFTDKNKNNLYDGDAEKVAFLPDPMKLQSDTSAELKLFQEEAPKTYIKKSAVPYAGYAEIVLNKRSRIRLGVLDPRKAASVYETRKGEEKDTVSAYYTGLSDTLALTIENLSYPKKDTVKLALPSNKPKRLRNITINAAAGKLNLQSKLTLTFPVWMDTTYKAKGTLKLSSTKDSLAANESVTGRWTSVNMFEIGNKLREGTPYRLRLDSNSFRSSAGAMNDTTVFDFNTRARADFGKLTLKLKLNQKQAYLVQLLNEQQKVVAERSVAFSLSSSNAVTIDFTELLPGTYVLKLIYDTNENKKWDTGDLIRRRLPEKVYLSQKQIKVLADWEIEEEITVKE